jgi:hypothetical protein
MDLHAGYGTRQKQQLGVFTGIHRSVLYACINEIFMNILLHCTARLDALFLCIMFSSHLFIRYLIDQLLSLGLYYDPLKILFWRTLLF